jgi:cell division protein FtsW
MKLVFERLKGDRVIWIVAFLLSMVSVAAVYTSISSLAYKYQGGNTEYYFLKHSGLILFGLFLMYLAHLVPYRTYSRLSQLGIYITIPLLFLTLISGTNLNSASRWLTLPIINVSFQTSDMAKLALIMYLARVLSKNQHQLDDLKKVSLNIILPIILTVLLIFPANFSTAMVLFGVSFIIMFIGGIRIRHLSYLIAVLVAGVLLMFAVAKINPNVLPRAKTWMSRIENFMGDDDAEGNYQADQAKIAIATGGFFGKGPGNSEQKNFLPHPYSDFIFAIIIEEYGVLGGFFILSMYMTLLYRSVRIASKSPGKFGTFLSIGLSLSLVFQAMINMGVAVNLLPVTGQPLPLVSMGGTSLWFTSISIGIILSVSRQTTEEPEEVEESRSKNVSYATS